MLILKSARCGGCDASLPLGPGILGFRPPPTDLVCAKCRRRSDVSFEHRVTWTFHYLWKLSFVAAFAALLFQARDAGMSLTGALLASLFGALLAGAVLGFIASYALALPVQLLIDVARPLIGLASSGRVNRGGGPSADRLSKRGTPARPSPRVPPKRA